MNIDEKIKYLLLEKQEEFRKILIDVLHDRKWFANHGIDYVDPDVPKVKEILFREEYEKYLPIF